MSDILFPRTTVGGISLPRMLVGTNWILGYSHTGAAADAMIKSVHHSADATVPMIVTALKNGIDAMMAPFTGSPMLVDAVRRAEEIAEHKMILIDTPGINVADTAEGRAEAQATIRKSAELGATFCLIHHGSAEQLVDKHARKIRRLDDYTAMIRDAGMIPGLSAHMPELILYSDQNGYDVETYIQIYNCMGFLMQIEIETVSRIIHNAKKPVMTIKPMAAGRCTPYVGLNFSFATLRDCDMVTVGCLNERELAEDIEIARAHFERRMPDLAARATPVAQAVLK